jgi:hypothetical protein
MVRCMKTTVEISDTLLSDIKQVAAAEQTTVRSLIEEGLRRVVADRRDRGAFRLPDETFRGKGLHPGAADLGWDGIRDLVYEGRGS